jgi:hypothetical protein
MKISEVEVGRKVIYTPRGNYSPKKLEEGVITSYNDVNVFVRYGDECQSKATDPDDLQYISK